MQEKNAVGITESWKADPRTLFWSQHIMWFERMTSNIFRTYASCGSSGWCRRLFWTYAADARHALHWVQDKTTCLLVLSAIFAGQEECRGANKSSSWSCHRHQYRRGRRRHKHHHCHHQKSWQDDRDGEWSLKESNGDVFSPADDFGDQFYQAPDLVENTR